MRGRALVSILLLTAILLVGCSDVATHTAGASANGSLIKEAAGEWLPFTVQVAQNGDPVGVEVRATLVEGVLHARLTAPDGAAFWERTFDQVGPHNVIETLNPPAGEYTFGLAWDGPLRASYAVRWEPKELKPVEVSPVALLGGIGMIAVSIAYIAYALKNQLGWTYLLMGSLAWGITIGLKSAWATGANSTVLGWLRGALPETAANWIFYLYVGLLTGVFEVIPVWVVLRYTPLGQANRDRALAFGIGFGAVEALFLGISSLGTALVALLAPHLMPVGTETLALMSNSLVQLAPIWERVFTILVHVACNILVFYGVATRKPRWFWASFALKSALDVMAVAGQAWGLDTAAKVWAVEVGVAAFGVASWMVLRWTSARYPKVEEAR